MTQFFAACGSGHRAAARLCLERGADINWARSDGMKAGEVARNHGHAALAAWLASIQQTGGWARHLSEPRYKLVLLRELCARGWARRERAFHGKERVLDLLFPGGRPNTRAKRDQPHLPDELFSIVARYYRGGGLSAEEEATAAAAAGDY